MPFEHFSGPLLKKRSLHVLWWAAWHRVSAVRPVLFIELKVMSHWRDENTLKLEDQVLSWAKPAGWQNWDGWSIVSTAFGELQLWEYLVFWATHCHTMLMSLWQSQKTPVITQAVWGAVKNKPCYKAVLLGMEKLLQICPSGGIMC